MFLKAKKMMVEIRFDIYEIHVQLQKYIRMVYVYLFVDVIKILISLITIILNNLDKKSDCGMITLLNIFLKLEPIQATQLGYTQQMVFNCREYPPYSLEQKRQILALFPIDKWVYTILSPITFIMATIILITFVKNRRLFGMPGDIIFLLSFAQLLKSYYEIVSGLYGILYDIAPDPNSNLCQINGIISAISFMIINVNVLAFAAYPLMMFKNALTYKVKTFRAIMGILQLSILIPLVTITIIDHSISLSLNGLCSIQPYQSKAELIAGISYLACIFIFLVVSIGFLIAFKKIVPKNTSMKLLRREFLRYYQRFMIFSIFMKFVIFISSIINTLNCVYFLNPYVNISETIENIFYALQSFGQIFILTTDPLLRQIFYRSNQVNDNARKKSLSLEQYYLENNSNSSPSSQGVSLREMKMTQFNIFDELHNLMKTTQLYTMLAGIQLLQLHNQNECSLYIDMDMDETTQYSAEIINLVDPSYSLFNKQETEECLILEISDTLLKQQITGIPELQCFPTRCILYAPKIFNNFRYSEQIEESLDLIKNSKKILEFANGTDGGKSGEFFFFSFDNKFIIKTMQQQEVHSLRKRLFNFGNYLVKQPNSLISKIYGMYTFERLEVSQAKFHFIIMKNISLGISKEYIQRIYDLKGSEFDREVLKFQDVGQKNQTLKDVDFHKLEQQIWISSEHKLLLKQQLFNDSNFLKINRLIDYSLLIMKIDWKSSDIDINKQIDSSNINILPSIKEPGIYYHIAIIDYLQQWNMNKGMERATKKIINLDSKLDTSAQDPETYCIRFQEKLINRILIQ